jgi:hypothetical protein
VAQEVAGSSPVVRPMEIPRSRVAESGLLTIDLEALLPIAPTKDFDLAAHLEGGLILREKPFRAALERTDWSAYQGMLVAIYCSADAIIPPWAYLLVAKYLSGVAQYYAFCRPEEVVERYRLAQLSEIDFSQYAGKRLLLKGCAQVSPAVMVEFFRRAQPHAQLIFYGEACSSVPIYKRGRISNLSNRP